MNAASGVPALTSALVHHSVLASPADRSRHAAFIIKRLGIAFGALAVAPFFLAFRGAPTVAQVLVFAWSFAPLAAAMLVAQTGRLVVGHGIAALGLVGLGLTLWGALGFGAGCAIACFAAAQLEATLSGNLRLRNYMALVVGLAFAIVAVVIALGSPAASVHSTGLELVAGLALAYAAIVTIDSMRRPADAEPSDDAAFWSASSEITDEFIVGFDAAGSVVRVPTARTLEGADASDLLGRGLFDFVHVADRPAFLKLVVDTAHGDEPEPVRLRLRITEPNSLETAIARPRYATLEARAKRVDADGDERKPAVVAALRTVDVGTASDARIVTAQASVDDAIRSKDHFLASMSHELRTPLNAIIGFSEMLASYTLRPSESDKQREYARIIHQSGQHLLSVVNSILDMSKIRSGTFAIAPEAFDIVPLLDLSCDIVALKANEGHVRLVREYPKSLDELIGDKRACKQILINLLSNAVKFTPEGGRVTVSAKPEGTSLVIAVSDTGIGISAADLSRLGDPFFQAGSSLSRPFEGTGLGLSVVRGLVGLHGGAIEIESEPGRGTNVKVRLPLDCRTIGDMTGSAKIETLADRRPPEPQPFFDRRMKQIA